MKRALVYATITLLYFVIGALPAIGAELNYRFVQGAVLRMTTTTDVNQITAEQGVNMPERSTQRVTTNTTQTVQSVNAEGNGTVQITYDTIVAQAQVGGQDYSWDSSSGSADYFFAPLAALLNRSVTTTVTPKGDVLQITGLKNMQDAALAGTKLAMEMGYDADQVASDITQAAISHLPAGDLAVNDTWSNTVTLPDPFSGGLNLSANYTYAGQEQANGYDCARVVFTMAVQSIPRMLPHMVKVGGVATDVQVEIQASGSGMFWLAGNEGVIVKYTNNMTVDSRQTTIIEGPTGEKRMGQYSVNATITETSDIVSYTTP
jgi:hypothetical protein